MASSFLCISTVIAQGTATYELTFTATWSSSTHPTNFPSGPHFSGMIGGTHNNAVSFWDVGSNASDGIKQMAELGAKGTLRNEINQAVSASNADAVIDASGLNSPGVQTTTFNIRPPWNFVTVTSMLAPSPDWFVGVSGLNLLDGNGNWINSLEINLFVYDAGTDSGPNYTSPNQPTNPREAIERITASPFLVDGSVMSVGTFRFNLTSVVGDTPRVSLLVDQNPVDEGEPVTVTVQLSEALSTDVAIPITLTSGTAESGDYDSTTPVSLNIVSGDTEVDHVIQTYTDNDVENETFTVELDVNNLPSEVRAGSPTSQEVTIRDPHEADISLSVDQTSVDEGESVTVTVQLSNALSTDVAIPLTLTSGTAESGDYDSTTPVSVVISSENTESEHVIQTYKDDDSEDETFTVELDANNLPSEVTAGSPISEEVTIRDLDVEEVSLSVDRNPVDEGTSVTVTVQLSNPLSGDVAIPLTLTSGTAESDDYDSATPVSVVINSGNTSELYIIRTYKDSDSEDETFTVELDVNNLPSAVRAGSRTSEEVTIIDLDVVEISLSVDQTSVDEGESVTVTVQLSDALNTYVTIPLTTTPGTAEFGDYDTTTPVLEFYSGDTEAEYVIETYTDDDNEDETFTVELDVNNLPSEVRVGSHISEEVTIRDLDVEEVSLSVDQNPVDEGESITVTIQLSDVLDINATIPLTITPGTAEPDDYDSTTPINLDINSGDTEAEYVIQTYKDDDIENESFTVALDTSNLPSGIVAGSPISEEVVIRDRDVPGVSLSIDQNPVDEGESITVTVHLSDALSTDIMIPLILTSGTAEPDDYDSTTPANLDINSGDTEAEYVIQTYKDEDIENESFTVELDTSNLPSGVVAGSPISEEITISDLDMPGISIPALVEFMEGETTSINVALTAQPSSDVTVSITGHENTDLTLDMNVLTFTTSNWNQEQTVTLTAAEDTDLLNDEVTLTLSTAGGGYVTSHTVTVTITDNMGVGTEQTEQIISLALRGNYPNPLSNTTKIAFDLPAPAIISVTITDLLGRTVKMLPYGSFGVGKGHTVEIDAEDLPSGVYYYTLKVVMDDQVVKRSKAMSVVR